MSPYATSREWPDSRLGESEVGRRPGWHPLRPAAVHRRATTRCVPDGCAVLEDRDGTRSTIITSQLPREQWHDYLGEPTVADAILDRVVHRAVSITLTGPSRRKESPRPEDREA